MCLDRDVTTLSKISTQKYPRCTSHATNMAATGSGNGQSNCKENEGIRPLSAPLQKSPVEYVHFFPPRIRSVAHSENKRGIERDTFEVSNSINKDRIDM